MSYTPRPWRAVAHRNGLGWNVEQENGWPYVAHAAEFPYVCIESESNAHLIAAAPDLLEALKTLVACCTDDDGAISPEPRNRGAWLGAMVDAKNTIAKAEGRSHE